MLEFIFSTRVSSSFHNESCSSKEDESSDAGITSGRKFLSLVISLGLSCVNDPESCGLLGLSDSEARLLRLNEEGTFDESALFDEDDTVKPAFLVELEVVVLKLVVLGAHVLSVLILRVYLGGFTILCTDPLAIDR